MSIALLSILLAAAPDAGTMIQKTDCALGNQRFELAFRGSDDESRLVVQGDKGAPQTVPFKEATLQFERLSADGGTSLCAATGATAVSPSVVLIALAEDDTPEDRQLDAFAYDVKAQRIVALAQRIAPFNGDSQLALTDGGFRFASDQQLEAESLNCLEPEDCAPIHGERVASINRSRLVLQMELRLANGKLSARVLPKETFEREKLETWFATRADWENAVGFDAKTGKVSQPFYSFANLASGGPPCIAFGEELVPRNDKWICPRKPKK